MTYRHTCYIFYDMAKKKAVKRKKSPAKSKVSPPKPPKKPQSSGKFTKGNTAGSKSVQPSRKKKLLHAEAFKAAITIQDVKAIARAMLKEAKKGDAKAAQFIMDRCAGKPAQAIALTGAEGEPLPAIQVIVQHGEVQS